MVDEQKKTWVPVYVEQAICDLIRDEDEHQQELKREVARVGWQWDEEHPDCKNGLNRWINEAIRQRRDLIALQAQVEHERDPHAEEIADAENNHGQDVPVSMKRDAFVNTYVATFLASYAAVKYDDNCMRGWPSEEQPVEDAQELAGGAWEQYQRVF